MAAVVLDQVSVGAVEPRALSAVSMAIDDGAFVCIVGPSGSGKSALLRVIAGLARADDGVIRIGDAEVTSLPPDRRDMTMVLQQQALFPFRSVRGNLSLPVELRQHNRDETDDRVNAEARALYVDQLLERDPETLSVGEAQMVQIARGLVCVPGVLLLDDPFALLDHPIHVRVRREIAMLQGGYGVTTLMVTNDPADVADLATHVAVMEHGVLAQFGTLDAVRADPATPTAALMSASC